MTGCFLGYDPGGSADTVRNGIASGNGVAAIQVESGAIRDFRTCTKNSALEVLRWFQDEIGSSYGPVLGIGIDTLTCWSGHSGGFRAADLALRCAYPKARSSVLSPNGLMGAMTLNGMFVLRRLRNANSDAHKGSDLYITETHPKVLHHALFREKYARYPGRMPDVRNPDDAKKRAKVTAWQNACEEWERMNPRLSLLCDLSAFAGRLDTKNGTAGTYTPEGGPGERREGVPWNDHEWDALVSAYAAYCGMSKQWDYDLFCTDDCRALAESADGQECEDEKDAIDHPAEAVEYRWPSGAWLANRVSAEHAQQDPEAC